MSPTDRSEQEFFLALQGEDELGMVVRAHIYIEAALNDLLNVMLVYPSHVKKMQLDYSQKVNLAIALGLLPSMKRLSWHSEDFETHLHTKQERP